MFNVSEFIDNYPKLTIATLGLAAVGYLAIQAVRWILIKAGLIEKVDSVAKKSFPEPAKAKIDLKGKWWTVVTDSEEYKSFKNSWKKLTDSRQAEQAASQFKNTYLQSQADKSDPYFGRVYNVPANFSLWMKGVAFLASYLESKKNIKGIYVCRDINNINIKIEEIHNNSADQKIALIVGIFDKLPMYPQHKVPILIEKKGGQITIALLDPMPESYNSTIQPDNILSDIEEEQGYSPYNSKEIVFRHIYRVCKNGNVPVRFLDSQVRRELHGGCAIFALQDAVAFLRDPDFFNKVHVTSEVVIDSSYKIEHIDRLPSECLIGTQSLSIVNAYKKAWADFNAILIGRKKSGNQYLADNTVVVLDKPQNHYITKKFFTYFKFLIQSLETMNEEDVDQIARRCLL